MSSTWSDWVFWIGGWALVGGGAILLLWAIRGDRSRGRARCRKCWYDMATIDKSDGIWTCPECGKQADRLKQLSKSRRRWRWALLASLFLLLAYPLGVVPAVRAKGWPSAVPSSILVYVAPIETQDFQKLEYKQIAHFNLTPQSALLKELLTRARDRALAAWQYQVLFDRLEQVESRLLRGSLLARDPWPAGEPLFVNPRLMRPLIVGGKDWLVRVRVRGEPNWMASTRLPWPTGDVMLGDASLGTFKAGVVELEAEILVDVKIETNEQGAHQLDLTRASTLWRGSLGTLQIAGTPLDYMKPYDSGQAREGVAELIKSVELSADGIPQLVLSGTRAHGWEAAPDWALGFTAELLIENRVFAEGTGVFSMPPRDMLVTGGFWPQTYDLHWTEAPIDLPKSNVTLRLVGDPAIAIQDLGRVDYWNGSVTVSIPPPPQPGEAIRDLLIYDGTVPTEHLIPDR